MVIQVFLLVGPPHGKNINKYIQNEGIYTYPGLENASWKIFKGKTHVMYTEFTPSKTKNDVWYYVSWWRRCEGSIPR